MPTPRFMRHSVAGFLSLLLLAGCTSAGSAQKSAPAAPASTAPSNSQATANQFSGTSSIKPTDPATAASAQRLAAWQVDDPAPDTRSYSHPAPAHRTQYKLAVTIDPVAMVLTGKQQIHLTNNESTDLQNLALHLFPNAPYFTKEQDGTPRVRPGSLLIDSIQVAGQATAGVQKAGGQILEVALPKPLAPGQSLDVALTWHETVPSVPDRLGVIGPAIYLGNFYPILAMHDQSGWHEDKYIEIGDPFYSEVSDYDAIFDIPNGWVVAATGHYDAPVVGDTQTRYHFTAENVRDFAAAASAHWKMTEADVDGIHIRYFRDQTDTTTNYSQGVLPPDQAMELITGSVHFYNQKWGKYPYTDLTIVDHIGMEYPQFIMCEATAHVIPHEVAHQWWYGVVGNDELRQIWDEGLTEFSAMYYQAARKTPKPRPFSVVRSEAMNKTLYTYRAHGQAPANASYASTIYGRGWMLWEELRESMGTDAFEKMVQGFYQAHKFGIATWDDWRQAISQAGGEKAQAIFDKYVQQDAIPTTVPAQIALSK